MQMWGARGTGGADKHVLHLEQKVHRGQKEQQEVLQGRTLKDFHLLKGCRILHRKCIKELPGVVSSQQSTTAAIRTCTGSEDLTEADHDANEER